MRARKTYSKEFKLDAVSLVLEQGYGSTEVAKSLVSFKDSTKTKNYPVLWDKFASRPEGCAVA